MEEKFTFFWNGPFSQWHLSKFQIDGVNYNCAEQYMMSEKALLFGDTATHEKIMSASSPRDQKKYGRMVNGFVVELWNKHARSVVIRGNYAKFTQNVGLKKTLLDTAGTVLVEASPYDQIWGIGLSADDPRALDRKTWKGTNWLGEVLTNVRERITLEGNNE